MKRLLFSAFLFTAFSFNSSAQTYQQQFALCNQRFSETTTSLPEKTEKINACLIETPAPKFKVKTIDGQEVELSALKGKIVVLNFWTTQCKSCVEQLNLLQKLTADNAGKDVVVVSLVEEPAATLANSYSSPMANVLLVPNAGALRTDVFKLPALFPYTVVVDKEGKIRKMWFASIGKEEAWLSRYQTVIDDCSKNMKSK